MKKSTIIIILTIAIVSIGGTLFFLFKDKDILKTDEKSDVSNIESYIKEVNGEYYVTGTILKTRDHDFSVVLETEESKETNWISLTENDYAGVSIGDKITITCNDSSCLFGIEIN